MSWGFEEGKVYNRRADIHAKFGGQQQGGIITPTQYPLVIIITGEEGLSHGYADRQRADGAFEYFGEGQTGDMSLQKGNRAIAPHSVEGKSLLLLRKSRGGLVFEDEMVYETHHVEGRWISADLLVRCLILSPQCGGSKPPAPARYCLTKSGAF
jgi:5-methylcytosine-specific restriction protein A